MDVAETTYIFSRDSEINVNEKIKFGSYLLENIPIPPEDERIMNDYESLQYMLCEPGYPETADRTSLPKSVPKEAISICILSSPANCMAVLLEGIAFLHKPVQKGTFDIWANIPASSTGPMDERGVRIQFLQKEFALTAS